MKNEKIILEGQNIRKVYNEGHENEVVALNGIDIKINSGELVSIMGPSGSGKTTLLNCLSGIDAATSGQIYIAGQDLQKMSDKKKTKYRASKMGFIFQSFNLIPVLTAIENVELPLLINGVSPKVAREKAVEILKKVGLEGRVSHKPNELSGGQRQRVTIARALVHEPAIVWADEPTGNLDRETAFEVFNLLVEMNRNLKKTIVVVTHDGEIAEKTDRIIKMESGKII